MSPEIMPKIFWLLLFALGGLGASFRHLLSLWITPTTLSLFVVNTLGCFLIGMVNALPDALWPKTFFYGLDLKLIISVGLLGGFTTFSSFSWLLLENFKTAPGLTLLYAVGSLIGGLGAAFSGSQIARLFS